MLALNVVKLYADRLHLIALGLAAPGLAFAAAAAAAVHGVEAGHGVRQNVTEPQTCQGLKQCPDCGETLEVRRVG